MMMMQVQSTERQKGMALFFSEGKTFSGHLNRQVRHRFHYKTRKFDLVV